MSGANWEYFASAEAVDAYANDCEYSADTKDVDFEGPGWYWVGLRSDRKPCGCCWDTVLRVRSADAHRDEIETFIVSATRRVADLRAEALEAAGFALAPPPVAEGDRSEP